MEIRRKRKKTFSTRVIRAVLPLGTCAVFFFLTTLVCLRNLLDNRQTRTVTEDVQHQLKNRKIFHPGSADKYEYEDPGSMDIPLTAPEISKIEKLRLSRRLETKDSSVPYDIHRCPAVILEGYPIAWSILDVLKNWNPDDTEIPDKIYQGLCSIDWSDPTQRKIAVHYRTNELPFLVKNHPVIGRAADRWSDYDYMYEKLGDSEYRNEHATGNQLMYWKLRGARKKPPDWKPPTNDVNLAFPDWYKKAQEIEAHPETSATAEHFYLRLNGGKSGRTTRGQNEWLYDELTFFDPDVQNDILMVQPEAARGINCRLGSRGIIAALHYDESRNFILILKGQKRYILGHPDQCINMELYPQGHPSARHSSINWSDPKSWMNGGTHFRNGMVNEVVLDAGDGLYLPTYWFHFIVSLSLNYQCNARSGTTMEYQPHIIDCGFGRM